MTKSFLQHTARDYDMPLSEVENIVKLYPETFYEKLEEYISAQAQKNNFPKGNNEAVKICKKCKHKNARNYSYCYECGAYL